MAASATFAAAILLALIAAVHSLLGERRLIGPILMSHDGVLASALARFVLRFGWHMMSVAFLVLAAALASLVLAPESAAAVLLLAVGIGVGGSGLWDAVGSRGRHIGWFPLLLAGACALAAFFAR